MIDPSLSGAASLIYSTYIGGADPISTFGGGGNSQTATGVAVDAYGGAYITGWTNSTGFPTTLGAFQTTYRPGNCTSFQGIVQPCLNAFVSKINPAVAGAPSLIYSSYLAGNSSAAGDRAAAIAVDQMGSAYVTGISNSRNFLVTPGAVQKPPCNGCGQIGPFITKFNAAGNGLVYSSVFDSDTSAFASSVAIDSTGNAYIAGATADRFFPVTSDAFQPTLKGGGNRGYDAYLLKLNPNGSSILYGSFLGGGIGDDLASGVAVDAVGDVYVAGSTTSFDFPITPGSFQRALVSGLDLFVSKLPIGSVAGFSISGLTPGLTPSSGGNVGKVSSHIIGSGIHGGASIKLVGAQTILGTAVVVGSKGRTVDVTFDLTGAPAGPYNLTVVNSDGTSATLPSAFIVQDGGGPRLWTKIVGPRAVAIGHGPITFSVDVGNAGNTDTTGAVLSLYGIPNEAILTPLFNISPIPTLPGAQPLSVNQLPFAPVVGQQQIPTLLLPPIPAGSSLAFAFTLTFNSLPPIGILQPPPPIKLIPPPLSLPHIQVTAVLTYINLLCGQGCFAKALALVPGGGCSEALICAYLNALQNAISGGGTAGAVYNLAHALGGVLYSCGSFARLIDALMKVGDVWDAVEQCTGVLVNTMSQLLIGVSFDPNDKEGVTGSGVLQWVSGETPLYYSGYFLNEATASAAAQQVVVTDVLDPRLDLSTLKINGVTLAGMTIPLSPTFAPELGEYEASSAIDFRPAQNLLVNLSTVLNPGSRTLSWKFASIDPTTGLAPTDPKVGVLPAGAEGTVSYSTFRSSGVTSGVQVSNQATIVFDVNPPMTTKAWNNAIDNSNPGSRVSAQPAMTSCPAFRVSWSGSDIGSGLQGFTIYASDSGGPFTPWVSNTTAAAATFTGAVGHTYSFYSIATDLAGNVEAPKTAEASTTVTAAGPCGPPSLSGQVSSSSRSGTTVTVNLQLTNTGFSGAQAVNINQITFRTLSGSGAVTLASPVLPPAQGPLGIGGSTTVPLTLNVPTTVTRFSMTESGNLQDGAGNTYNYSMAQTVIP